MPYEVSRKKNTRKYNRIISISIIIINNPLIFLTPIMATKLNNLNCTPCMRI